MKHFEARMIYVEWKSRGAGALMRGWAPKLSTTNGYGTDGKRCWISRKKLQHTLFPTEIFNLNGSRKVIFFPQQFSIFLVIIFKKRERGEEKQGQSQYLKTIWKTRWRKKRQGPHKRPLEHRHAHLASHFDNPFMDYSVITTPIRRRFDTDTILVIRMVPWNPNYNLQVTNGAFPSVEFNDSV